MTGATAKHPLKDGRFAYHSWSDGFMKLRKGTLIGSFRDKCGIHYRFVVRKGDIGDTRTGAMKKFSEAITKDNQSFGPNLTI